MWLFCIVFPHEISFRHLRYQSKKISDAGGRCAWWRDRVGGFKHDRLFSFLKRMLLLNYVIAVVGFSMSLRGHSTIWRKDDNQIVKRVIYDESLRMNPKYINETEALNNLPKGWEYEVFALPHVEKLLCRRKRRL